MCNYFCFISIHWGKGEARSCQNYAFSTIFIWLKSYVFGFFFLSLRHFSEYKTLLAVVMPALSRDVGG